MVVSSLAPDPACSRRGRSRSSVNQDARTSSSTTLYSAVPPSNPQVCAGGAAALQGVRPAGAASWPRWGFQVSSSCSLLTFLHRAVTALQLREGQAYSAASKLALNNRAAPTAWFTSALPPSSHPLATTLLLLLARLQLPHAADHRRNGCGRAGAGAPRGGRPCALGAGGLLHSQAAAQQRRTHPRGSSPP